MRSHNTRSDFNFLALVVLAIVFAKSLNLGFGIAISNRAFSLLCFAIGFFVNPDSLFFGQLVLFNFPDGSKIFF